MVHLNRVLPIRKISSTEVSLSSYYGKYFVSKASIKREDIGYWLKKLLTAKYEEQKDFKDMVYMENDNRDAIVPNIYAYIARYVKSFTYKNIQFNFEFASRAKMFPELDASQIAAIETHGVIVGVRTGCPVIIDVEERLWVYKNEEYTEVDDFYTMLGISREDLPVEFASIKIYNQTFPIVLLLSYYVGLEDLLRVLETQHEIVDRGYKNTDPNKYIIRFRDNALLITKDYADSDLILYGLTAYKEMLANTSYEILSDRTGFDVIFSKLELPLLYRNELRLLETMYVDPVTESILKELGEPITFKGLLIRCAEILVDDNYVHPNNINGVCIKGYERISGMMYKRLVMSLKDHENRSHFSKSKMMINSYSMIQAINEDSTTVLVDDINPIAMLKQVEDTTYLGEFGRSKDGMSKDTRSLHPSEIGIISEASKDSGDVGITAYLSAAPKLKSTRGLVGEFDIKKDGFSSIFSTSAMIAGFPKTDDPKRLKVWPAV